MFQFLILGMLAASLPFIYGLVLSLPAYIQYGLTLAFTRGYPWFLLAILAFCTTLVLCVYRILISRHFIAVHQHGIYLSEKKRVIRWEALTGIAMGVIQNRFLFWRSDPVHRAILYLKAGNPILLTGSIQNISELITRIKVNIYPKLLSEAAQLFMSGQRLEFGPLAIQKEMIWVKGQQYSWKDITQMTVLSGFLVIKLTNINNIRLPIINIPNLEIIFQITKMAVNN